MTSDGNMDLHKGIKSTRNGKYMSKYIGILSYYLMSLKDPRGHPVPAKVE